jgi:hypothetical protein
MKSWLEEPPVGTFSLEFSSEGEAVQDIFDEEMTKYQKENLVMGSHRPGCWRENLRQYIFTNFFP